MKLLKRRKLYLFCVILYEVLMTARGLSDLPEPILETRREWKDDVPSASQEKCGNATGPNLRVDFEFSAGIVENGVYMI